MNRTNIEALSSVAIFWEAVPSSRAGENDAARRVQKVRCHQPAGGGSSAMGAVKSINGTLANPLALRTLRRPGGP